MKRAGLLLFLIVAALLPFRVLADTTVGEASELTPLCQFTSSGGGTLSRLYDGQYTTRWTSRERSAPWLECTLPEGRKAHSLYVCFASMPEEWYVEVQRDGEWRPLVRGGTDYMHAFVPLDGVDSFRLSARFPKAGSLVINELSVFGEGTPPDWVQRWEPTPEKADLLVLAAHPDDELIYFGGLIPTYHTELGKKTVVAYMTGSNTTRVSELLNGLWSMGVRSYPVIGPFYDGYSSSLEAGYQKWPRQRARAFVMELVRRYRPDVMVTHDVNGEYGHGAHRVCADVALYCAQNGSDPSVCPESAVEYGVWEPQKLYLHLYGDDPLVMNWNVPLSSLGGRTGLEAARDAYALHVTQRTTRFTVTDEGPHSCAVFGLAYTSVGEDVARDDLFEHVLSTEGTPRPAPTPEPTAVPAPTPAPLRFARPAVTCEWPERLFCERDALGYPAEGEHVIADEEGGMWFYASPTLVVRIDRRFDESGPLTWYEAEIFADTSQNRFASVLNDPEKPQARHVQLEAIATRNQVVFGMNTDYYTYRVGRSLTTGVIIRDGELYYDNAPKTPRGRFPNLDTLALFPDGTWLVSDYDAHTGEDFLRMGARDVFSFGPWLLQDGEVNDYVLSSARGRNAEPRCAVGYFENGHYFALMAEGRMGKTSAGVTLLRLTELMREAGCRSAFNLDGGQTAAFTFMGRRVTRVGTYSGGRTYPRATTELLGIGRSELIDPDAETE